MLATQGRSAFGCEISSTDDERPMVVSNSGRLTPGTDVTGGPHFSTTLLTIAIAAVLSGTDANGNTIGAVNFAALGEDEAYGRLPNGSSSFRTLSATPGAANPLLSALAIEAGGDDCDAAGAVCAAHGRMLSNS